MSRKSRLKCVNRKKKNKRKRGNSVKRRPLEDGSFLIDFDDKNINSLFYYINVREVDEVLEIDIEGVYIEH